LVNSKETHAVGSLLFCSTVLPLLLSRVASDTWFLDDFTLGGLAEVVARKVSKVVEIDGELGLYLNVSECELSSHDGFIVTDGSVIPVMVFQLKLELQLQLTTKMFSSYS